MQYEAPVNSIPAVVILLTLITVAVEITFSAAEVGLVGGARGIGWRVAAIEDYAFSPVVWDYIATRGDFAFELVRRFFTYPFINSSFTGALFSGALTLALGKFVGEIFGNIATLIVYVASMLFGAVVFGVLVSGTQPLYGGFTPVYGLIGAYTYVVFVRLGSVGENQLKAFQLIAVLLGIQLVFGLMFGSNKMWIAELAGFATGFAVSILAAPGGWSAFLRRMRRPS